MTTVILKIIPESNLKRITQAQISKSSGLGGRDIRKHINFCRTNGIPVCSDSKGYYISHDPQEIQHTINHLKSRIVGIQNAINGLEDFFKKGV